MDAPLPAGFEPLEPFIDRWVLPDSRSRSETRRATSFDDIKHFYDAALPLAPEALKVLAAFRLEDLPPAEERLLKLMLALAEVGPAVEWYGQPDVIDGFPADRFPLIHQLPDTARQEP